MKFLTMNPFFLFDLFFFFFGGVFFYKLTRNPNLTKNFFLFLCVCMAGGGGGSKRRGRVSVHA